MKNRFNNKFFIGLGIAISLLVNMIFVLKSVKLDSKRVVQKKEKRVKIVFKSSPKKKKQIVNTSKKDKRKPKKETEFLSHSNQRADRQTVSKNIGKFKEAGKGVRTASEKRTAQRAKQAIKKSHKRKRITKKRKKISLADLAFKRTIKPVQQASQRKGIKSGRKDLTGFSRANDFVEDIPLGDMTALNTTEYKYYGFYFRIRQKLEQYWGQSLQEKAKKFVHSGRRGPASENHITSLKVVIDSKGNIIDIALKSTSGITELDEAAIESFNKAGPFPNPPKGMIKNGSATIEWGFVVKS